MNERKREVGHPRSAIEKTVAKMEALLGSGGAGLTDAGHWIK